ncbi:hypothetical protein WJX72_000468 [[Myrmecia] bisecta]|uniref:ABC transporter domain-containing protein n=1 Tax=[Myrmecia] bisecta TaxID=41462 RepID=A0AAW1PJD5_9CHLO
MAEQASPAQQPDQAATPQEGDHERVVPVEGIPPDRQIVLSFTNVSGWVPTRVGPPSMFHLPTWKRKAVAADKPEFKQIMYNITGQCKPGEVLAMMGPSGSGKTSLLSVLGGRTPKAVRKEGSVLYNGERLTKRAKRLVGFVLQDDLLYETLTVWETLYFAAMLRLPKEMSTEDKKQRVQNVITALGLEKCKNTIIGGFFRRGISGGERKRVSVGHELLINPSILMLDEPTSGLDSTTAMHLVQTLRQLATGGRSVVTTIHQPSSRLYQLLDKLLLLSNGHVMYYGVASGAAEYFHKLGYALPFEVNTADFILDLASGDVVTKKLSGDESMQHLINCAEHFLDTNPDGYVTGAYLSEADFGPQLWTAAVSRKQLNNETGVPEHELDDIELGQASGSSSAEHSVSVPAGNLEVDGAPGGRRGVVDADAKGRRWGAPYSLQLRTLFQREVRTRRFEVLGKQDFIQFLIVGALAGLFWLQKGQTDTTAGAQNVSGLLFFEMMFLAFRSMLSAIFLFPSSLKMLLKERASGMYRLSAFYFARSFSDLPIDCTIPTIFICIIYFMGGLRYTPAAFFANWASVLLLVLVAQSLGLLIGATVSLPKTAQTIASVVALANVLVAGFFVVNIAPWIGWLKYVSFIFYGYNLLLHIEFKGRTLYNCGQADPANPAQLPAECTPVTGAGIQQALRLQYSPNEWPWFALVLLGFLIVFRILIYVALRKKTTSKVR